MRAHIQEAIKCDESESINVNPNFQEITLGRSLLHKHLSILCKLILIGITKQIDRIRETLTSITLRLHRTVASARSVCPSPYSLSLLCFLYRIQFVEQEFRSYFPTQTKHFKADVSTSTNVFLSPSPSISLPLPLLPLPLADRQRRARSDACWAQKLLLPRECSRKKPQFSWESSKTPENK